MTRKNIPFAQEVSLYGDFDQTTLNDPGRSVFYIDGYSDRKQKAERAVAEGRRPEPLPFRFHWVTSQRGNGQADRRKISEFLSKGYEIVRFEDALDLSGKWQINLTNSSAIKDPDGYAQNGDTILMACTAQVAARWEYANKAAIDSDLARAASEVDAQGDPVFTLNEEVFDAPRG